MGGREDDPPLERKDFSSAEDWARYRREAGLAGSEYGEDGTLGPGYEEIHGGGEHAAIYRGVLGHDAEQNSVIDFVDHPLFGKLSFGITESAWIGMYMGIVLANCRGIVLNSMVNISWSTVGISDDEDVADADADFRVSLRNWLKAREAPLAWVWCLENGSRFGLHSHILAHIPDEHRDEFRDHVPDAVAKIAKHPVVDDTNRKIRTVKVHHVREDRFISQWAMFKYMSKSIDDGALILGRDGIQRTLREVLGIKRRQRSAVFTKRAGVNQKLQEPERERYFKEHGRPHIGLNGATGPRDVFGDRYLVWGREMRERRAALEEVERGVDQELRFNAMDPFLTPVMTPVPGWALEMWEDESRRNRKSKAAFYLSLFRYARRP